MSSGPVEVYNGTSGVANAGGDSLTEDLNIYYSVCKPIGSPGRKPRTLTLSYRQAISPGS